MAYELDGTLTVDKNAMPVQVLELDTVVTNSVTASSQAVTLPSGTVGGDIIRVAASENCYIVFGATADANDHLFIQGVEYFRVPDGATQLSVIRVDTNGVLSISRTK